MEARTGEELGSVPTGEALFPLIIHDHIRSFFHLLIHSLVSHSLIHLLNHSGIHLLIHSFT